VAPNTSQTNNTGYLLPSTETEWTRQKTQAEVWLPAAEMLLGIAGVRKGARAIDVGCGAAGVLEPLSRLVGEAGQVVGLDHSFEALTAAQQLVLEKDLLNVDFKLADAWRTGLPSGQFDFVHSRFLIAPVGRGPELAAEMRRLAKPGGVVAFQEPDASSWHCHPYSRAWERLREATLAAFELKGGNFNAGQQLYDIARGAGLQKIQLRAHLRVLKSHEPYAQLPAQFARLLRPVITGAGVMTDRELDELLMALPNPDGFAVSFTLVQVWGRTPLA
jgi:SAM-dependent methyltransferase